MAITAVYRIELDEIVRASAGFRAERGFRRHEGGLTNLLPTRDEAERLLEEAHAMNPGPWRAHSRLAAWCAERIAARCAGLDPEKAYIFGLLHDVGRRCGVCNMRHVIGGYRYLMELGYDEAARICLTHSFAVKGMDMYMGVVDVPEEDYREIEARIEGFEYDDYDRLISCATAWRWRTAPSI